ncbi:MAG: adenylyl-sulfate kinase [Blastocatellia bacterium]|nr:adenylyl-sulfate kinase [Blastocatellia bacterium]MCS7157907.1 adenylyl-sulfate kinase [Blastocatellia bacterium]MCX7753356.1 adenylyl-sulfate kinase [Blastocatellia bacterium]MDW8168015.1 adenylyl-sulfate kinase [Acidobacteriota bacterium]MDW8255755.1 adenylyl-sulfate kinase [Acidobacteriota bacterium]
MESVREHGFALWFTGLPSSGKTTIARLVERELRARGLKVEVLDGDEVRQHLSPQLGFSKEERDVHIRRIAYVAQLLVRNGIVAIVAAISPYRETRQYARDLIGRFVEVYVNCPLEVCIERDVKGLYKKALRGEITNFTGISDPYEEPLAPELVISSHQETPTESARRVLARLIELGYLRS